MVWFLLYFLGVAIYVLIFWLLGVFDNKEPRPHIMPIVMGAFIWPTIFIFAFVTMVFNAILALVSLLISLMNRKNVKNF